MRIVLDTNILIGAWLEGAIELVTSTAQLAEIAAVLARPRLQRYLDADEAAAIVENLDTRAVVLDALPE